MLKGFNKNKPTVCFSSPGDNPKVSKGTQVTLPVRQTAGVVDWGVSVERSEGTVLTLKVATPPSCIVGCWKLHIDSLLRPALFTERSLHRYTHPQPVYILFNPWATGTPTCSRSTSCLTLGPHLPNGISHNIF